MLAPFVILVITFMPSTQQYFHREILLCRPVSLYYHGNGRNTIF